MIIHSRLTSTHLFILQAVDGRTDVVDFRLYGENLAHERAGEGLSLFTVRGSAILAPSSRVGLLLL